jgi:glucosamine-phosphate N-acetyltransferase
MKNNLSIIGMEKRHMSAVIELLQLMSELKPFKNSFESIWHDFQKQQNVFSLVAIYEEKVISYGLVVIETKIRGGKKGHIKDIVTDNNYRKKGIGKGILDALYEIAKEQGFYKTSLQCTEHNEPFYKKYGYETAGVGMQLFLQDIR